MALFSPSIFANHNNQSFKFWNPTLPVHKTIQSSNNFWLKAKKKKQNTTALKTRYYSLNRSIIFYKKKKESRKISNYADLSWSRVVFRRHYEDGEPQWHIYLLKNTKFTCLYPVCEEEFFKWKKVLKSVCIFTDFEEKYVMVGFFECGNLKSRNVRKFLLKNPFF